MFRVFGISGVGNLKLFFLTPPITAFKVTGKNNSIFRLNCAFKERMWRQEK